MDAAPGDWAVASPLGVVLRLRRAGPAARAAAAAVDLLVAAALLAAAGTLPASPLPAAPTGLAWADPALRTAAAVALVLTPVWALVAAVTEVVLGGRSLGKAVLGLRVLRRDGQPAGTGDLLLRELARVVDVLPVGYALGALAWATTGARLGDHLAATVVVVEPRLPVGLDWARRRALAGPGAAGARLPEPPAGAPLAAPLRATGAAAPAPTTAGWDLSRLDADTVALAREFGVRRWDLAGWSRALVAAEVAAALRSQIPGIGSGLDAETVLDLVLGRLDAGWLAARPPGPPR